MDEWVLTVLLAEAAMETSADEAGVTNVSAIVRISANILEAFAAKDPGSIYEQSMALIEGVRKRR